MTTVSDPAAPPAYALNAIHAAGYEPYAVDNSPDLYRLPGLPPKTWRECMEDIAAEHARLRSEVITLQNDKMILAGKLEEEQERAYVLTEKISQLSNAKKSRLFGLAATAGTAIATSGGIAFLYTSQAVADYLPAPYNHIVATTAALLVARITKGYTLPEGRKKEED